MTRAREALLAHGVARAPATSSPAILLALFGVISWKRGSADAGRDHAPAAAGFPVHLAKDLLLGAHRHRAAAGPSRPEDPAPAIRAACAIDELFVRRRPPSFAVWPAGAHQKEPWASGFFGVLDRRPGRVVEPRFWPKGFASQRDRQGPDAFVDRAAERRGRAWRDLPGHGQCGDDVRRARLWARSDPRRAIARASIEKLSRGEGRTRPTASRACLASLGHRPHRPRPARIGHARPAEAAVSRHALEWLKPLQILDVAGDWSDPPGPTPARAAGPSSTAMTTTPTLDDTAVVAMAMDRADGRLPGAPDSDWRHRDRPGEASGSRACRAPGRRLGRLRRRQHLSLPQPHPLRRPRRPARSRPPSMSPPDASACSPSWASPPTRPRMRAALAYLEPRTGSLTAAGSAAGA